MMNKQTLYLCPEKSTVIFRDGPALRVKQQECADRLYPINRIASIVTSNNAQWETAALMLCSENNVAVHFISKHGEIKAHLLSPVNQQRTLDINTILQQYLHLSDSDKRFKSWLEVQYYMAYRFLSERLAVSYNHLCHSSISDVINAKLDRHIKMAELRIFQKRICRYHIIAVADHLRAMGIDTHSPLLQLAKVNFAKDLGHLCYLLNQHNAVVYLNHLYHLARKNGRERPVVNQFHSIEFFEKTTQCHTGIFESCFREFFQHILESIKTNDLPF